MLLILDKEIGEWEKKLPSHISEEEASSSERCAWTNGVARSLLNVEYGPLDK